jgi:hypothetical protein
VNWLAAHAVNSLARFAGELHISCQESEGKSPVGASVCGDLGVLVPICARLLIVLRAIAWSF